MTEASSASRLERIWRTQDLVKAVSDVPLKASPISNPDLDDPRWGGAYYQTDHLPPQSSTGPVPTWQREKNSPPSENQPSASNPVPVQQNPQPAQSSQTNPAPQQAPAQQDVPFTPDWIPVPPTSQTELANNRQQPVSQLPSQPEKSAQPDVYALPDTSGRVEGDEWDSTLPDGRIVHNRIPFGNGNQSVDQWIPDGNGGITYSRVAANDDSGWQRWNLNADGSAFYGTKYAVDSDMYAQNFNPGSSTSGLPDHAYVSTPDYKGIKNPSYDQDGNLVGVDVAVPNEYGLYDNYHYDKFQNLTISTARPDGKGGIESVFVGQFDPHGEGWQVGPDGKPWQVGKDLQGHVTMGRSEQTAEGTHVYFMNDKNVIFDTFYGIGPNKSYTDIYNPDKSISRRYRDGTSLVIVDNKIKSVNPPPDSRNAAQKGWDWIEGAGNSLKTWGVDVLSSLNFAPGLQAAANPLNPAAQAAAADHYERTSNAIAAPGRLLVDGVASSAGTLGDWWRYRIVGALYGLTGDPYTPYGRAQLQLAQQYMDKAPADWEALLAATTFLPVGGATTRVGTTLLRSTEIALGEAATATAARQSVPSLLSRGISFDALRKMPGFATNGIESLQTLPGISVGIDAMRNIPGNLAASLGGLRTFPERFQVWRDAKIDAAIDSVIQVEVRAKNFLSNTQDGYERIFTRSESGYLPQLVMGDRSLRGLDEISLADILRTRFAAVSAIPRRLSGRVAPPNPAFGPVRPRANRSHQVDFKMGRTANTQNNVSETIDQISGQVDGINKMTANELLHNLRTVARKGKAQKDANKIFKAAVKQEELKKALRLLRTDPAKLGGKTPEKFAEAQMKQRTKGFAALHEPDIVAGGKDVIPFDVNGMPRMGDRYVNSSLGSQWAHRGLANDLRRYAEDLVRAGQGDHLLNVEWSLR
ncbi:polymorphic toxin type 15 domain-containing protein [Nocardia sp. NPDC020380]|uniref:polymorphic toxin type 15 domain-containing protein n=1 Tax=Nocardia sp. NPDC020380 TaxID=3364309 RepID=UPI00378F94A4